MAIRRRSAPKGLKKVVFLVGPTAIGKTCLAIQLARRLNAEIISCDSMQVYRGMRILSQAPSKKTLTGIRHHLIGFLTPQKEFSVARFRSLAARRIKDILKRGKVPLLVGGSGLYVKALIDGLFQSPKADPEFRKEMFKRVSKYGAESVHEKLFAIDPEAAANIHPNDSRRVIRALEIYVCAKKTMTELKKETRGLKSEYDIAIFGLNKPRGELYEDIGARVEHMFAAGVVEEVKNLMKRRLSRTAKAILGFDEIEGCLKGRYGLERAKEALKRNTRRLAKKQLTWFRADKRIEWFDVSKMSEVEIVSQIAKAIK